MPIPTTEAVKARTITVAIGQQKWVYQGHGVRHDRTDDTIEIFDLDNNHVIATAPRSAVMIEW